MSYPQTVVPRRELHISRRARERYRLEVALFAFDGRVVLADFRAARDLAQRIAADPDTVVRPGWPPSAGALHAMGLVEELLHAVFERYRRERDPQVVRELEQRLERVVGRAALSELLAEFVDEFPPQPVYAGIMDQASYLAQPARREAALEELILLWLGHNNPAFAPYAELFDDSRLRRHPAYAGVIGEMAAHLTTLPSVEPGEGESLLDLLLAPVKASPHDLQGQLAYIRARWGAWLGDAVRRLLGALDLLAEENRPWFPPGPGPVEVPVYPPYHGGVADDGEAPENYSADLDWMPTLVLIAKNAYVWLEQLSRAYQRSITSLDQVPDRELDLYAKWGISGLWLIGVWERSRASERIKKMMGDREAVASAYSLLDYNIAADLGGEAAFFDLKERAMARGIRMATDMVPNHVGIDSRWVIEHPNWFIGRDDPPFPSYSFNGPDLCDDERVGIYLEDHYYDRSDAAVVFKRVDHWTGAARYIYHGNDGTSMPWNDTAQLDYLNPEVREAVIQTILHVARLSPVIRFDAAMTLAKKPYQRLWFPEPGSGGDIPSRAEHGMSRADFDRAMPVEFWREVVDRVAAQAPDTLLLAEAFWLLEGYFVRTLGMHRVYNSAFMNMLRDEKNAEYRQLIKNTLEYDPQILKRYVNFMSNPDEETAIEQFGVDDKYFGVATMMATLPGLPMFGHGQIEGFREKYGMEFRSARWQESPDHGLLARHERQLFPLLHRRRLFAEVEHFLLFDLVCADGSVDENVFAFSNRLGDERALVVYHNRFGDTRGRLQLSTAVRAEFSAELARHSLAHGLAVVGGEDHFVVLRELVRDEEFLVPSRQLMDEGLWVELFAYGLQVYVAIREVVDDERGRYRRVCDQLAGRSVRRVERAVREIDLAPILTPIGELITGELLQRLASPADDPGDALLDEVAQRAEQSLCKVAAVTGADDELVPALVAGVRRELAAVRDLHGSAGPADEAVVVVAAADGDEPELQLRLELVAWALVHPLAALAGETPSGFYDDWLLEPLLADALVDAGLDEAPATHIALRLDVLASLDALAADSSEPQELARAAADVLRRSPARRLLGVNRFAGQEWYQGEALDELLDAAGRVRELAGSADHPLLDLLRRAAAATGYRYDLLLAALEEQSAESGEPIDGRPGKAEV